MVRLLASLLIVSGVLLAQASCGGPSLALGIVGGRLGDPFVLGVAGAPLAAGVLGLGTPASSGPFGFCLPISGSTLVPIALDGSGVFAIQGLVPPLALADGLQFTFQAAVLDGNAPSGIAVSPLATASLRSPRVFAVSRGVFFGTVGLDAAIVSLDGLDGSVDWVTTFPLTMRDAVRVGALGSIVAAFGDDSVRVIDEITGAVVATFALPFAPTSLTAAPDGAPEVLAYDAGSAISGVPGRMAKIDLISGTLSPTLVLPGPTIAPLHGIPETQVVYVYSNGTVLPIDISVMVALPAIPLPSYASAITGVRRMGNELWLLLRGVPAQFFTPDGPGGLFAVDPNLHLAIPGRAVQFASLGFPRAVVPANGPSGEVLCVNVGAGPDRVLLIDPLTLSTLASVPLTSTSSLIVRSEPSGDLAVVTTGVAPNIAGTVARLDSMTTMLTAPVTLAPEFQSAAQTLRSTTSGSIFVASGNTTLFLVPSEPALGPPMSVALPISAGVQSLLQDSP